jgi:hypothetical protein
MAAATTPISAAPILQNHVSGTENFGRKKKAEYVLSIAAVVIVSNEGGGEETKKEGIVGPERIDQKQMRSARPFWKIMFTDRT